MNCRLSLTSTPFPSPDVVGSTPSGRRAPFVTTRAAIALRTFLLLLAVASVGPGHVAAQAEGGVSLPIGTQAPTAAVQDLDGNPLDLRELVGGRPAVIEFWASWCENCEALQPQLDELQERYGEALAIVAVAVGVAQTRRRVRRHAEGHDFGYPFVWDADGAAVRAYDALATSIVVMLDTEGRVAYTGVGAGQDLVAAADRLMGG